MSASTDSFQKKGRSQSCPAYTWRMSGEKKKKCTAQFKMSCKQRQWYFEQKAFSVSDQQHIIEQIRSQSSSKHLCPQSQPLSDGKMKLPQGKSILFDRRFSRWSNFKSRERNCLLMMSKGRTASSSCDDALRCCLLQQCHRTSSHVICATLTGV